MTVSFIKNLFGKIDARRLVEKFGSPLYVYDEEILRDRCREIGMLLRYRHYQASYSAKANSNIALLQIIREEGLGIDAVSPGEIYLAMKAGFTADCMMFIGNNVSPQEMQYAIDRGILVSVDSLAQLELLGELNRGGRVCLRINPGIGAGHHQKVVTAGKNAKFGIMVEDVPEAIEVAGRYNMKISGLNQHIGSLFLNPGAYLEAAERLLDLAAGMPNLELIDFGGGFGVPYRYEAETRLDIDRLGQDLDDLISRWRLSDRSLKVIVEPGRYIAAECGALLGTVYSVKENYQKRFIGTDLGFNVLMRPAMYDSFHEIDLLPTSDHRRNRCDLPAYVVGNICESGDILAHDRLFPETEVGDLVIVREAGAYGFSMASNYNSRLLPAEVLIELDGNVRLIRRRQRLEDL